MTRKKVKLAYITNDSARKATYKKRKKGLIKKVSELSTLCGIQASAIIYSPYESQPEVWPSAVGVHRVLSEFKKRSEMDQNKKMVNQETYLRGRISKSGEQLKKQCKDNREKEMTHVMFQNMTGVLPVHCVNNMLDLNDIGWLVDQNLKDIDKRIEMIMSNNNNMFCSQGSSSSSAAAAAAEVAPPPPPPPPPAAEADPNVDLMQRQQWIMDLLNNPQEHNSGFGADEMMFPFGDNINHNALWSNAFFPWEK